MLCVENLVIFVVCDVLVSFILFFMWYDTLFNLVFIFFCQSSHFILSVFVTNKSMYYCKNFLYSQVFNPLS